MGVTFPIFGKLLIHGIDAKDLILIDTIICHIPLESEQVPMVEAKLQTSMKVDNRSGVVMHEIVSGHLSGSWDYNIRVTIRDRVHQYLKEDTEIMSVAGEKIIAKSGRTVQVSSDPFLRVEFSLPKWSYGVNFLTTSFNHDFTLLTCFKSWLSGVFGFELPDFTKWEPRRLDLGYNYDNITDFHLYQYLDFLASLDYPRRGKPVRYKTGLYWQGAVTTTKLYIKSADFIKHDQKRLRRIYDKEIVKQIKKLTSGVFRYETEFHNKKLKSLGIENITDLIRHNWTTEMDKEKKKIFGKAKVGKVTQYKEVVDILSNVSLKGAGVSFGNLTAIWNHIVMNGETDARRIFGKVKVWRAKKVYEAYGISLVGNVREAGVSDAVRDLDLNKMKLVSNRRFTDFAQIVKIQGKDVFWYLEKAA